MTKVRNKIAFPLAIISGILLLVGGFSNSGQLWTDVKGYALEYAPENAHTIISYIILFMIFFAVLGGISVILGGLLIRGDKAGFGKFLIMLGAGMGIIGLAITIVVATKQGTEDAVVISLQSITGIGIILSIAARMIAK